MNCTKCEVLVHALIDGELDAGHTSDAETHVATCFGCTQILKTLRAMREAMAGADLKWTAPAHLRRHIEAALPLPVASASAHIGASRKFLQPSRRTFFGGFADPCRFRVLHLKSKLVGGRAARPASGGHDRVAAELGLRRRNRDDRSIRPGPPGRMGRFSCGPRLKGDCEP